MSHIPSGFGRKVRLALGTTVAVGGLVVGAATGVQALTSGADSSASTASCTKVHKPKALVDAMKAARKAPAGAKRVAAKAAVRKDVLAGKYGKELQARAEKARDRRLSGLPAELRAAVEKVQAMPKGDDRTKAAQALHKAVLDGKYGTAVQAKAKERSKARKEARKERQAASTPALTAARHKVAAMDEGDAQKKAAIALRKAVLAGTYGEKAKAYAEQQATARAQAKKELKAKAKQQRAAHKEACAKQD